MAPRVGATAEDDGYLVTFTIDTNRDCSEAIVLDAANPADGPIALSMLPEECLDPLFGAVVQGVEEAVLDVLFANTDMTGIDGRTGRALPHAPVLALLDAAGRLTGWTGRSRGFACPSGSAAAPTRPGHRGRRSPAGSAWIVPQTPWPDALPVALPLHGPPPRR